MATALVIPTVAHADDIPSTLVVDTSGALPDGITLKDVIGKDDPKSTQVEAVQPCGLNLAARFLDDSMDDETRGGDYTVDFKKAAQALIEHAKQIWARFIGTDS